MKLLRRISADMYLLASRCKRTGTGLILAEHAEQSRDTVPKAAALWARPF